MLQQIIALAIIITFIWRLFIQKKKKQINSTEFSLWLIFWLVGGLAIIFIRKIDAFLIHLGFSSAGINFLFYIAVIVLFYLIFKLRLTIAKMDENITKISRQIALTEDNQNTNQQSNNEHKAE